MILLDKKSENISSSPLNISTPKNKSTLSFSDFLKGVSDNKDAKTVQNGSIILSLNSEEKGEIKTSNATSKGDSLLALLKSENNISTDLPKESLELNEQLTSTLSKKDIKALVEDAKNYLKIKIEDSEGYKKSQIKELPKTLNGLVEVAKKIGVDISKISVEEVKAHQQSSQKNSSAEDGSNKALVVKENSDKQEPKLQNISAKESFQEKRAETSSLKEPFHERKTETLSQKEMPFEKRAEVLNLKEPFQEKRAETSSLKEAFHERKTETLSQKEMPLEKRAEVSTQREQFQDKKIETLSQKEMPLEKRAEVSTQKNIEKNTFIDSDLQNKKELKSSDDASAFAKETKSTPMFKTAAAAEYATTEQVVQAKKIVTEQKTPKDKANETLNLLLRTERASQINPAFTADFSVATAKVIATTPDMIGQSPKEPATLEKLLNNDSSDKESSSTTAKSELLTTHKADSFEVKLNEAKQMIKYLSGDVKTAIEDYKSPFTRVKIQLTPERLGEVDLTIVQRGKNLHVNIGSNNTAINTLSMNVNELKVQLNNSGINNATLNFSDNSQNSGSASGQQQQQRQNEQQAHQEYSYFENQELNEEILSSLEIIVPQYG